MLIEEWVLRSRIGDAGTMRDQLRHLLSLMPLPSVSLGVNPAGASRTVWPLEAFYAFDEGLLPVETLTARVRITQPREIADYLKAFRQLGQMAVYGDTARRLIESAIAALG